MEKNHFFTSIYKYKKQTKNKTNKIMKNITKLENKINKKLENMNFRISYNPENMVVHIFNIIEKELLLTFKISYYDITFDKIIDEIDKYKFNLDYKYFKKLTHEEFTILVNEKFFILGVDNEIMVQTIQVNKCYNTTIDFDYSIKYDYVIFPELKLMFKKEFLFTVSEQHKINKYSLFINKYNDILSKNK